MALIVKTNNPNNLVTQIKKAIDSKAIVTWSYDTAGDFTHTPEQWKFKGWMRAKIIGSEIHFAFVGNKEVITTSVIYAVYHGRFLEMLLTHFDEDFTKAEISALPITGTDQLQYT
jgi:hypothetical protein